ncbi:MAG: hypothetical protein HYT83_03700 [Candidatus Levybacteria bacterium]|nr:hypothetical protein [Candidatus Levybacteria bacterium]
MRIEQAIQRQGLIAREAYQYLKRDFGKYATGAIGMWVIFGADFKNGDAQRCMYYFFRNLDDVLDGDRTVNEDPFAYASNVRTALASRNFDNTRYPILSLAQRALEHCDMVKRPDDDPLDEMLQLIDSMVYDRYRMQGRVILSKQDLAEQHQRQFYPIINLQLISLGSRIRVRYIPDFPIVQGRVYGLRDMESDWNKGLINIPAEVLEAAGLDVNANFETVQASPVVQQWILDECIDCGSALEIENQRIHDSLANSDGTPRERIALLIFENLVDGVVKYISSTLAADTKVESASLLPFIAAQEALRLNMQYAKALQIKPTEMFRYLKKSASLAACYAGFAQSSSRAEAIGAGKAAFLSCAYDVASDWKKPMSVKNASTQILRIQVSSELADMALGLLERDLKGELRYDGLERGIVALNFVLEMMGLRKLFEERTDVDRLGIQLQIVDDVLDFESDGKNSDQNCLTSLPNRSFYLTSLIAYFDEESIHRLFPHAGVLGFAIRRARKKAINILTFGDF